MGSEATQTTTIFTELNWQNPIVYGCVIASSVLAIIVISTVFILYKRRQRAKEEEAFLQRRLSKRKAGPPATNKQIAPVKNSPT